MEASDVRLVDELIEKATVPINLRVAALAEELRVALEAARPAATADEPAIEEVAADVIDELAAEDAGVEDGAGDDTLDEEIDEALAVTDLIEADALADSEPERTHPLLRRIFARRD